MITAIVQARMNSSRFPGKVLQPIQGKPMVAHVLERVISTEIIGQLGQVVLAIPFGEPVLYRLGEKLGVKVLGYTKHSEDFVLDRFLKVVETFDADPIIRITGDCPLIDPQIIGGMIQYFLLCEFDYLTNRPSYPDGYDCEVFSRVALEQAGHEVVSAYDREHVTSYFRDHPEKFKLGNYTFDVELPLMKVSVDTPEELELVDRIMNDLGELCGLGAVLEWWNLHKAELRDTTKEKSEG